ncbi:MAG: MgtC/SapB family protein [Clostridiales bacterium]|nr:MgtC/SapB family protein [Clostridia bacterium]MCR4563333.1 MgtC/SapB family protein [Clostridiales bacterium]
MEVFQTFLNHIVDQLPMLLRIVVACICGAAIGYERSVRQKDAGIRTHIIVALGAALMMIVSKYGFFDVVIHDSVQVDASRIASTITTGISFLGAGVIFVRNASIKGLTTAAGIWATAGVGIAIGSGMYLIGIVSTILMIIIQIILHKYLRHIDNNVASEIKVTLAGGNASIDSFIAVLEQNNLKVQSYSFNRLDDKVTFTLLVRAEAEDMNFEKTIGYIRKNENVLSLSIDDVTL